MRWLSLCAAVALLGSCRGGPAQPVLDDPAPEAPEQAVASPLVPTDAERRRIGTLQARFSDSVCDPDALDALRDLRGRFGPEPVKDALTQAFTACGDASAMADLAAETLPEPATAAELGRFGALLLRADRFEEAAEVLVPVAESPGATPQVKWLAGFALLHAGEPAQALPLLSAGRAHASGPGNSEGPMLMGLAHLQLGEPQRAVDLLKQAAALDAENPTVMSALARALADAGQADAAVEAAARVRELHGRLAERERAQMLGAALIANLETAWAQEHDAEVLRLSERLWVLVPSLRPTLLEYRIGALARLGRTDEADAARRQLAQLRGEQ